MRTRKQYMDGDCTHREYYAQFVSASRPEFVADTMGKTRLMESTDPDFNDIPLHWWGLIPNPHDTYKKMKDTGDWPTQSSAVCISKEAARQWVEAQG